MGGFLFYVSVLAEPGECGSEHPDLCFGFGILGMLVAPVAMLTTPVALVRLAWRGVARWRSRPPRRVK